MYVKLKDDNNYEILNEEPFTIRHMMTKKVVRIRINRDGYTTMTLSNMTKYYHKVLATQFIDNPNGLKHVRFIDGDHTNISLSNLEWSSRKDINRKTNRVKRKSNDELKELKDPEGLSRSQLRRWNKIHNVKDYIDVKPIECDSHLFDGFL